jgi:hypothetical protein
MKCIIYSFNTFDAGSPNFLSGSVTFVVSADSGLVTVT